MMKGIIRRNGMSTLINLNTITNKRLAIFNTNRITFFGRLFFWFFNCLQVMADFDIESWSFIIVFINILLPCILI